MGHLILALLIIAVVYYLASKIKSLIKNTLLALFGLTLIMLCGLQVGSAYVVEKVAKALHLRVLLMWTLGLGAVGTAVAWGGFGYHPVYEEYTFSSLKYALSALLFLVICFNHSAFKKIKNISEKTELIDTKESNFYLFFLSALLICASAAYIYVPFSLFPPYQIYFPVLDLILWFLSLVAQVYAISLAADINGYRERLENFFADVSYSKFSALRKKVKGNASEFNDHELALLINAFLVGQIYAGRVVEVELQNNDSIIIDKEVYDECVAELKAAVVDGGRLTHDEIINLIMQWLPLNENDAEYYLSNHVDFGGFYNFNGDSYFVAYSLNHEYRTCASCGVTEAGESTESEWYCSDICRETEKICLDIKQKPFDKFLAEASVSGFVVMEGASAWDESHRRLSPSSNTAHGNAAEKANHMIDKIYGKKSRLLGDDNAKNGADRVVDGVEIQSKYCENAEASVRGAFDSAGGGNYRYIDKNNRPMVLEVPKDQYEKAVAIMEDKIKAGKVPGVNNPEEAKNIVKSGNITYQQAKNITKFGTFESIKYDMAEGAIVSLSAAGISFGVTAAICYLNTKDKSKALRAASLTAGKVFGKTMVVYVSAQQLHRISMVEKLLVNIDPSKMPPSIKNMLGKGMGLNGDKLTKAFRGTVVTSIAIIAISIGPDMVKMIRGRISGAQFLQNLAVISSSVVGGTIGSIAGGALCSPLGPGGVLAGRFLGGMIGGTLSGLLVTKIAGKLREDDRAQMIKILEIQIEYLAVTFMVTKEEMDNINKNLATVVTQDVLEKMYAAKNKRFAVANVCLKPVFVSVVKQRPMLTYGGSEAIALL